MFPTTGSTITAAMSSCAANSSSRAARSLKGAVSVSATAPGVTPGESGNPERRDAGARLHEQEIRVPVVAADELDDLRPPGEGARDPNRAHRRLRAGAHEADELEARHRVPDETREVELERARRAEARSLAQRLLERGHDARMRVTEDQRAPREHVVDVAVPVDVDEIGALAAIDEERRAAHRLERTDGRADAARQEIERLRVEPFGRLARHAGAPARARATDSAASSPERMQSGMPTPRYAAPATREPRVPRQRCVDLRETLRVTEEVLRHPEWPAVYLREQRRRVDADAARPRSRASATRLSSESSVRSRPPNRPAYTRISTESSGARPSHFCDVHVQASTSAPSTRGTRYP